MAILKPLLGALTVTAGTVSIGCVIAFPEMFGLGTDVSVFVTSSPVIATGTDAVPTAVPGAADSPGAGIGTVGVTGTSTGGVGADTNTGTGGTGTVLGTQAVGIVAEEVSVEELKSNNQKINCKFKNEVDQDVDCSVFSVSNYDIATKKHVNSSSFNQEVKETTEIATNSYYKIDISKETWKKWSSDTTKKIIVQKGEVESMELTMLFALPKNNITLAKKESDQQHYFVGKATKDNTNTEITKGTSYECAETNTSDQFKACQIYDFVTTDLTLTTESTTVTKDKQYVIKTTDPTQKSWYVKSDNKQMQITNIKKSVFVNDVLFILDK